MIKALINTYGNTIQKYLGVTLSYGSYFLVFLISYLESSQFGLEVTEIVLWSVFFRFGYDRLVLNLVPKRLLYMNSWFFLSILINGLLVASIAWWLDWSFTAILLSLLLAVNYININTLKANGEYKVSGYLFFASFLLPAVISYLLFGEYEITMLVSLIISVGAGFWLIKRDYGYLFSKKKSQYSLKLNFIAMLTVFGIMFYNQNFDLVILRKIFTTLETEVVIDFLSFAKFVAPLYVISNVYGFGNTHLIAQPNETKRVFLNMRSKLRSFLKLACIYLIGVEVFMFIYRPEFMGYVFVIFFPFLINLYNGPIRLCLQVLGREFWIFSFAFLSISIFLVAVVVAHLLQMPNVYLFYFAPLSAAIANVLLAGFFNKRVIYVEGR